MEAPWDLEPSTLAAGFGTDVILTAAEQKAEDKRRASRPPCGFRPPQREQKRTSSQT